MPNLIRKLLISSLSFLPLIATAAAILLVEDANNVYQLPKQFRSISNLHVMASAQFSQASLDYVLVHHPKPGYIIDLRQESHGFINGTAVSWYAKYNWANVHRSPAANHKIEQDSLANIKLGSNITIQKILEKKKGDINKLKATILAVDSVMSEQQLAEQYGIKYLRIPVPDHQPPTDQQVDQFVNFIKDLPPNTWLYLHCKGGKGRTTTFTTLIDMIKYAKTVTFDEIIARQHALGGTDLAKHKPNKAKVLADQVAKRYEFLKKFYEYAHNNSDNFRTGWLAYKSIPKSNTPLPLAGEAG